MQKEIVQQYIVIEKLLKNRSFPDGKAVDYDLEGGSFLPYEWDLLSSNIVLKQWSRAYEILSYANQYFSENPAPYGIKGHAEIKVALDELSELIKPELPAKNNLKS